MMASSLLLKLPVAVRGAAKILGVTRVKNMLEKGVSQAEIKRMAQNTDRSIPSGISSKARKNLGGGNISSLVNKYRRRGFSDEDIYARNFFMKTLKELGLKIRIVKK